MSKRKTKAQIALDNAWFGGLSSALAVLTTHGQGTLWREILEQSCDPHEFRAWAEREDLLDTCGFNDFQIDWEDLLRSEGDDD